jgi:hypothetical protein
LVIGIPGAISGEIISGEYCYGKSLPGRNMAGIADLDGATNDRLLAEHALLPGIGIHELVFGLPYYRIVNAAF